MPHTRRDVWKLPAGDDTLEWYGKAIGAMQRKPLSDVTSWWSLAAMHGIDPQLWDDLDVNPDTEQGSPTTAQEKLWDQCQHQTWFFLPWHRGYLAAFEAIVRDTVKQLNGPADWTLPYWNYSDDPAARELPRAFAQPTLADGSRNFLNVAQRYGKHRGGAAQSPIVLGELDVVIDIGKFFTGHGIAGFGGLATPFHHGDSLGQFGGLETQPHGSVHVAVGGQKGPGLAQRSSDLGLMTNPDTAALDPIFWLHHANIDRLWSRWLSHIRHPTDPADAFANPTDANWLDGPRDQPFALPRPDGTTFGFTARDVLDTTVPLLDYVYDDDVVPAPALETLATRFERLGASPIQADQLAGRIAMAPPKAPELIGASDSVRLDRDDVEALVTLDPAPRSRLAATLSVDAAAPPAAPDRVYLTLENIRSPSDAALFYVYVDLPKGADPAQHRANFAGPLSMFGVSKASSTRGPNAGNGATVSLDITTIVDRMHARGALGDRISVRLVSAVPGATSDNITIGRISVYRQGP